MQRPLARNIHRRRHSARRAEDAFRRPLQALSRACADAARGPWLLVSVFPLLLLAGVGLGTGMRAPLVHAEAGARTQHASVGRASPPDRAPNTGHWSDPQQQTAYTLRLQETTHSVPGQFVFLLPNGGQVRGFVPLRLQPDNTTTQQASSSQGQCAQGVLAVTRLNPSQIAGLTTPISPAALAASSAGLGYATPIVFSLTSRIGQYGLVAYAGLSYAAADDAAGVSRVCGSTAGAASLDYQMASGCTADACTDPLATAGPAVGKHDGAIVHAAGANTTDAWREVYNLSARSVTGQYTDSDFAAIMTAQTGSKGRITQISPITSAPAIQFDAAGQAYYSVTQTVTLDRNGTTSTQQITSYYLLEGGAWLFWFSA
jgi:hypothetical protein